MTHGITDAHCNACGRSTTHEIAAVERQEFEAGDDAFGNEVYEILRCRGCNKVTLRHTTLSPGSPAEIEFYPPAIARRTPNWIHNDFLAFLGEAVPPIPSGVCAVMREVYIALQNGARRLAAMGVRAALEGVMIDKVSDQRSFKANLDAFQRAGYLSERQSGHLEAIIEAGHAAMHRDWQPSDYDLGVLLDIAEAVIASAYLHDEPADSLNRRLPPRPRRRSQ